MHDLKQDTSMPTPLFIGNHGAMLLAKNPIQHNNTKHIDVRHHYVRECVAITLRPVASVDNITDICNHSASRRLPIKLVNNHFMFSPPYHKTDQRK